MIISRRDTILTGVLMKENIILRASMSWWKSFGAVVCRYTRRAAMSYQVNRYGERGFVRGGISFYHKFEFQFVASVFDEGCAN